MKTLFIRVALFVCLCLGVPVLAQAPPPAPAITFSLPSGTTVLKSSGLALITAQASYAPGVRCLSLSGGWCGACAFYPSGYPAASTRMYFYASYYPAGDYTFTATATGFDGHHTVQSILVHVK